MPGLNGFQATRQLTRDPATSAIPVIIVTTKSQEADRVWGVRQGARGYLVKPVDDSACSSPRSRRCWPMPAADAGPPWPPARPSTCCSSIVRPRAQATGPRRACACQPALDRDRLLGARAAAGRADGRGHRNPDAAAADAPAAGRSPGSGASRTCAGGCSPVIGLAASWRARHAELAQHRACWCSARRACRLRPAGRRGARPASISPPSRSARAPPASSRSSRPSSTGSTRGRRRLGRVPPRRAGRGFRASWTRRG